MSPEDLQIRSEHSRSLEDAEQYKAIQTLTELGQLIPLEAVETYHGRLGNADEEQPWAVDPTYANGGNDNGNNNVNARPTLYAGDKQLAIDFAHQRKDETTQYIYNSTFGGRVSSYTPEEKQRWLKQLNTQEAERWAAMDDRMRQIHIRRGKQEPKTYVDADLSDDYLIYHEERRLEAASSIEDKAALRRNIAERYRVEAHEISSADSDAVLIDFGFDSSKLPDKDKKLYSQALAALAPNITDGSPLAFEDRDAATPFVHALNRLGKYYVEEDDVKVIADDAGISLRAALQLSSAYNAKQITLIQPGYLIAKLLDNREDIITEALGVNGRTAAVPINLEYAQRFMERSHIVGARHNTTSATLDRSINTVSFIDLDKAHTVDSLEIGRQATANRLGAIATTLSEVTVGVQEQNRHPLVKMLEDVHVKPEKLVQAAQEIPGYKAIFDADAGNWEGYSLAEHTETVLRNFDESFADAIPVELLKPMRLAILVHDIGKSVAASSGEKHLQKQYNERQADDFLDEIQIDDKMKQLLQAVIGRGAELAFAIDIRHEGESAELAMKNLALDTLKVFYHSEHVTEAQITGFKEMCRMLQICDGGAYTSMAITRPGRGNGRYRNAPTFNASFAEPVDSGKRKLKLRS